MAAVPQERLNWLYSVLTSEYHDVNRTYNDVAQALSQYSSLSPRTDVFTFENGTSALLLLLSGTVAASFRGTTYRFPIAIWVPYAYPREPPMIYVTPTEHMVVRAGQHVDPQGKLYHPYLARWAEFWDKSNLLDFLAILRDIFSKEPPVVAKQSYTAPPARSIASPTPPTLPAKARDSPAPPQNLQERPPPPPPKQSSSTASDTRPQSRSEGPPLPPLPLPPHRAPSEYSQLQSPQSPGQRPIRYDSAPPHPPQPQTTNMQRYPAQEYMPQHHAQPSRQYVSSPLQHQAYSEAAQQPAAFPPPLQQTGPPTQWGYPQEAARPAAKQPPPDLIDAPLTLSLPTEASTLPAPPIPPNPEKDLLLQNLANALYAQRQMSKGQNEANLPGLDGQRQVMLNALQDMNAEMASLEAMSAMLATNTNILHTALRDGDAVIEGSAHATPPAVDELLVAPTVVGNQLYELVSEERALGDAIFVLSRAVQKGRIQPAVFAKTTRALGRELYLKKALVKKIGTGMGLAT